MKSLKKKTEYILQKEQFMKEKMTEKNIGNIKSF